MPYSLVLNLIPLSPIQPGYLTGRHLHALFLNLVSSVHRPLGDYLHQSTADKAFTLSPLQVDRIRQGNSSGVAPKILQWQHRHPIPTGSPCWWRISLLDEALFGQLTQLWLNLNPEKPWHLGSADLHITSIFGTSQSANPWANSQTYRQLYEEASEENRLLAFQLATPVAFRQGKHDTALPTRESVFNSLLNRWNKYSGIELSKICLDSIFPSYFNISTEIVADSRSKFIGCVGEIHYRVLGNVAPEILKSINVLADFSLYAGIGRKTTMSMGMVRRVNS